MRVWTIAGLLALSSLSVGCNTVMDYLLCYHPGYAKFIKIDTFVMDSEQVAKIYDKNHPEKPYQKPSSELIGKDQFLVLHFTNYGPFHGSGTLKWRINDQDYFEITIWDIWGEYRGRAEYYVIPLNTLITQEDKGYPIIEYKWKRLFTD